MKKDNSLLKTLLPPPCGDQETTP